MALQKSGVQIVTQGADKAIKSLDRYRQALERATKAASSAERGSGGVGKLTKGVDKLSGKAKVLSGRMTDAQKRIKGVLDSVSNLVPGAGRLSGVFNQASGSIGNLLASLKGIPPPALAAAAAVAVLAAGLTAIIKLGARGARLEQTAQAFGNMVADAGNATTVLQGLRRATRGAISDFELMRLTTLALAGQQSEFRKELLAIEDGTTAVGRVIDATRRIAAATGLNEEVVREKFLTGLRLQSRLRLDDVGVAVDAAKANERYAESIGKSAAVLTEQEKKAAFAREGIRQLDEIMLSFGDRSTVLERFARPAVALKNILDNLALAAVPAFTPIAMLFGQIGDAIESIASFAFPVLIRLSELVGNVLSTAFTVAAFAIRFSFIGLALKYAQVTLPYVVAAITLLLDAINALFTPIETLSAAFGGSSGAAGSFGRAMQAVNGIVSSAIASIGNAVMSLLSPFISTFNSIRAFTVGAMTTTLAFLNNAFMTMAFTAGAGGGAITGAFAAGLLRGGTKVVDAVTAIAQIVADFLQGFSPPKVGPLSRIDQGGFNVAKSWAEGFQQGFVRPMQVVKDEITSVLGEIGNLVASDLETRFKALDIALLPFTEQLDLAKARVEQIAGFVDPALKAVERQRKAALQAFAQGDAGAEEVRQYDRQLDRLRGIKEQTEAISDQAEIEFAFAKSQQSVQRTLLEIQKRRLDLFGKEEVAAEAIAKATEAAGGAGGAGAAAKAVKDATAKADKAPAGGAGEAVMEEGLGGGLTTGDAPDLLSNAAVDSAREGILGFFSGVGDIAGGVAGKVGEAGGQFGEGFATGFADSGFDAALGEFNAGTGRLQEQISRIAQSSPVQAITDKFSGLATILTNPLADLTASISGVFGPTGTLFQAVNGLFVGEGLFGPEGLIRQAFMALFGEESPVLALLGEDGPFLSRLTTFAEAAITTITGMKDGIEGAFADLRTAIADKANIIGNIINATFTSFETSPFQAARTTIETIFNGIKEIIQNFSDTGIVEALANVGSQLVSLLETPFVEALNAIVTVFENTINNTINSLPGFLRSALGELGIGNISIPRLTVPGAASGALGLKGLAVLGEKGPELVNLRRPANVFPANATRSILDMMGSPVSPMGPGQIQNNTTNNNNNQRTVNANFNNTSPRESLLILRELEAL